MARMPGRVPGILYMNARNVCWPDECLWTLLHERTRREQVKSEAWTVSGRMVEAKRVPRVMCRVSACRPCMPCAPVCGRSCWTCCGTCRHCHASGAEATESRHEAVRALQSICNEMIFCLDATFLTLVHRPSSRRIGNSSSHPLRFERCRSIQTRMTACLTSFMHAAFHGTDVGQRLELRHHGNGRAEHR